MKKLELFKAFCVYYEKAVTGLEVDTMKKFIALGLACILALSIVGCGGDTDIAFPFEVSAAESIMVAFYSMGQTTEWELSGNELSDWMTWAENLSGKQVSDEKMAELQMTDGGESYHFRDGKEVSFTYVLHGQDVDSGRYVVFDGIWYEIANPVDPF